MWVSKGIITALLLQNMHTCWVFIQPRFCKVCGALFISTITYRSHLRVKSHFLIFIRRIEIEDSEAVGISNIISNLITMFPRSTLTALPSDLFTSFINCLTLLTCSFGRSAALEEVVSRNTYLISVVARNRPRNVYFKVFETKSQDRWCLDLRCLLKIWRYVDSGKHSFWSRI